MAWYDSVGSWFGGSTGGSNWWDSVGDGWLNDKGSDSFDWGSLLDGFTSSGSSGGSSSSSSSSWLSKLFGGASGSGGSTSGSMGENIFGAMLGGVGGMAEGLLSEKAVKEAGKQARKNYSFQAELQDFYAQKGKARKRAALDTYGQFSLMDRWAPNATVAPPVDMPNKPQE